MAYSSTNPPALRSQAIAGPREWVYSSTDNSTAVATDGYFTNGWDLGMRAGDLLYSRMSTSGTVTSHVVLSASAGTTTVVLGDPTTVGSTTNTA